MGMLSLLLSSVCRDNGFCAITVGPIVRSIWILNTLILCRLIWLIVAVPFSKLEALGAKKGMIVSCMWNIYCLAVFDEIFKINSSVKITLWIIDGLLIIPLFQKGIFVSLFEIPKLEYLVYRVFFIFHPILMHFLSLNWLWWELLVIHICIFPLYLMVSEINSTEKDQKVLISKIWIFLSFIQY